MRIVSLCPSLTELVFELGAGHALVGRTKFCVQPEGLVDAVETVGGTKSPKIDRIVALAPDLVLMNEEENRLDDAVALRGAGIACHTSMPRDVSGSVAVVRALGSVLGREDRAERIALDIAARRTRVCAAAALAPRISYAYLIWRKPYMTVSADTYVSALLSDAGGENVFGNRTDRYPPISPDDLRHADPRLVLLSSEPFPFKERHIEELIAVTSFAADRFRLVDGELLSWHGPRTGLGVEYAREVLTSSGIGKRESGMER
jgi:ABC-type Fe3+-hydroxamate transport system substrate-binding protein